MTLQDEIRACRLCAARFANTASGHTPNPVIWYRPGAPVLIVGQAPGIRVHHSGRPFTDPSGDRLRQWLGLSEDQFYDRRKLAILPMAFCFPGHNDKGGDLPPPRLCAETWRDRVLADLGEVRLTVLLGRAAMAYHLGERGRLADHVADWRNRAPGQWVLPHPSWRNNAWLRDNPWFEEALLPVLRAEVKALLS